MGVPDTYVLLIHWMGDSPWGNAIGSTHVAYAGPSRDRAYDEMAALVAKAMIPSRSFEIQRWDCGDVDCETFYSDGKPEM